MGEEMSRGFDVDRSLNIMAVMTAMGWAYRGDLEQARRELAKLPVEELRWVSAGAALTASLADEVAAEKA